MCCDFEVWQDGSKNCYLYSGGDAVAQDMNDFPDDEFHSILFPHLFPTAAKEEVEGAKFIALGAASIFIMSNMI